MQRRRWRALGASLILGTAAAGIATVSSPLEAGAVAATNFAVVNVPESDALTAGYFRFLGSPGVSVTGTSAGFTASLTHPGFTGFTIEYAPKTGSTVAVTPQQLTTTGSPTATQGRLVISEGPLVCADGAGDVRIDDVAFGGGGALSRLAMTWALQCNSIPSAPITSGIITFGQENGPIGSPAVSEYFPISPARLLDTRDGSGPLGPQGVRNITVTGANGVPGNATAVVVNVTGISPTAPTFLTVFPAGTARPLASNVNPAVNDIVPNLATVKVGASGQISLYNEAGNTHAAVDIMGYFAPDDGAGTGGRFYGQTPQRLIDTRDEPRGSGARVPIGPGGSIDITVDPSATAKAAVLNVTAAESSAASFLSVYPTGEPLPAVSNLNFSAAQNIPNLVVVKLNAGKASIYNSVGNAHVVVDLVGLFKEVGPGITEGRFLPIDPVRAYDSRDPKPQGTEVTVIVGPDETRDTNIVGLMNKYPFEFAGYIANTTVTATGAAGFLTSFPAGVQPDSSTLNWLAGETRPNLVMMGTDAYGFTSHRNASTGSTHLILDVAGWFTR